MHLYGLRTCAKGTFKIVTLLQMRSSEIDLRSSYERTFMKKDKTKGKYNYRNKGLNSVACIKSWCDKHSVYTSIFLEVFFFLKEFAICLPNKQQ